MSYSNGKIPLATMVPVQHFAPIQFGANAAIGSNLLIPEAKRQLDLWQAAYAKRFSKPMPVSEAYRPLLRQDSLYQLSKAGGALAAVPGTSNHGWGRAVDLGAPISTFGTPERIWCGETAAAYGFTFDVKTEAWHATYSGNPTITPASSGTTPIEEDDMYTAEDRARDVQAAKDAAAARVNSNQANERAGKIHDLVEPMAAAVKDLPRAVWAFTLANKNTASRTLRDLWEVRNK